MKLKAKVNSGHKAPILRCQFGCCILSFLLLNILSSCKFSLANEQRFSIRGPKDCEEINSKSSCQCKGATTDYFEIMCPKPLSMRDTTKIDTFELFRSDLYLSIECLQMNSKDYAIVPNMSIGDISIVRIENCPLSGDAPIAGIFEKLGVTNVTQLYYESSNLDGNLTRLHLNGFHLPEHLFHDLGNLTKLELYSHDVELPANIFEQLENLRDLELGNNNLNDLPAGIFSNLHKLFKLNIRGNKLRQLENGTLDSLSSLSSLDLNLNSIETLEPNIFKFLTNLSIINLSSNRIKELPRGLFANTKKLSEFRLRNNSVVLRALPESLLSDLPILKKINLNCYLEVIPASTFANSTSIEEIYLDDNHLITLPETLFHDQVNLRELDLSNNRLTELSDNLFKTNKNLKVLKLLRNQLKEIKRNIFKPLIALEELYMYNNHLIRIEDYAFFTLGKLKILQLQNNRINFRSPNVRMFPIYTLSNLEEVNLRNNSVRYTLSDWKNLSSLKALDLSYNKISNVASEDLVYLTRSQLTVDMTNNEISTINFIDLIYLKERNASQKLTLDLNRNPLNCDCTVLEFVKFLRGDLAKNLADNIIVQADNLICQEPENLKNKYVRDVSYTELLCALDYEDSKNLLCPKNCKCFERTYDLTIIIDCSQGNRTEIPELPSAKDLNFKAIELNMSNNNLIRLPTMARTGYSEVTKLILAGNKLQELYKENLPLNLTDLDLRFNEFKLLNEDVITMFNRSRTLQTLYLSENPWQCDCEAQYLLQYAQSNLNKIRDYSQIRCEKHNRFVLFRHLSVSEICDDKTLLIILLATLAVFFLLIALISVLYLKYQIEIKVWLYAHKMCLWFVTEEELDKDKIYDAFIAYSSKDEDFVVKHLVPNLENGTPAFKICVHYRDFLVGENISINIANAVENSRRTIVLLSKNFLESSWARHEFRSAHLAALEERKPKVIIILYGDIGNIDDLDSELKAYLKTNTYLQWNDPLFWERLRYAMPHSRLRTNALTRNPMQISVDDNFELINTTPVTPPLTTQPSNTTNNPLIAHLNGGTPQTANGKLQNCHINGAFIINPNSKQSDV